jgi:acyl-CoA hydrolase
MGWKQHYAAKLVSAGEAAAEIGSGEAVHIGMLSNMRRAFAQALVERAGELRGVRVFHYLTFP